MALRLRRGTDAQRQLITPAQGELIFVTDTNELYAGDGSTLGGIRISGESVDTLNQLDDVDAALPQDGDVLIYDSATGDWVSGELPLVDLPDVNATGIVDGQVLAWDDTTSAFIPTNNIGGGGSTFDGDLVGSVFSDDSTLLVDGINKIVTADLEGNTTGIHFGNVTGDVTGDLDGDIIKSDATEDLQIRAGSGTNGADLTIEAGIGTADGGDVVVNAGSGLTNGSIILGQFNTEKVQVNSAEVFGDVKALDNTLLVDGTNAKLILSNNSLSDLADVNIDPADSTAITNGAILAYDPRSNEFRPVSFFQSRGVDEFAVFNGHLDGTFQGTILSDDSTMILDGFTRSLVNLTSVNAETLSTSIGSGSVVGGSLTSKSFTPYGQGQINITRTDAGVVSDSRPHGNISFVLDDADGTAEHSRIQAGKNSFRIINDPDTVRPGVTPDSTTIAWVDNKLGVGYRNPPGDEVLQVAGSAAIDGYLDVEQVRISGNSVSATESNANLELSPNGTGTIELNVPVQTTVGAAGAASALPATPSTYLKINVNGTDYVVPAYAVS